MLQVAEIVLIPFPFTDLTAQKKDRFWLSQKWMIIMTLLP